MQRLTLVTLVGLVALVSTQSDPPPKPVYRGQAEYRANVSCPNAYTVSLEADSREGFHICTKGNIINCEPGSTWFLELRRINRCQICKCSLGTAGLGTADCNKIDCQQVPEGTPLPRRGALRRREYRQKCRIDVAKVCDYGCNFLAQDRRCVYCDCARTLKAPFYT